MIRAVSAARGLDSVPVVRVLLTDGTESFVIAADLSNRGADALAQALRRGHGIRRVEIVSALRFETRDET